MLIKIKVLADSKKEEILKEEGDCYLIKVREPAKNNLANKRVLDILSLHFNIARHKLKIVKGSRQPNKIIEVKL